MIKNYLPYLQLNSFAIFGAFRPIFRCELAASFRVRITVVLLYQGFGLTHHILEVQTWGSKTSDALSKRYTVGQPLDVGSVGLTGGQGCSNVTWGKIHEKRGPE